jgi:hypothetical protein
VPLYGYKWADEKKSRYIWHPFTKQIVERIFMEAAMGRPIRRIAVELTRDGILTPGDQYRRDCNNPDNPPRGDAWAKSTVWNILKHPAYYGQHSAFRWEYLKRREVDTLSGENVVVNTTREREIGDKRVILADAAPPIISLEIAEAVAARLASNQAASQRNNKHPEVALLRGGFAKCGLCEGNMIVSFIGKKDQQVPTYRCGHSRYSATGANTCRGVTMSVSKLDKAVWDKVIEVLKDPEVLEREARSRIASGGNADAIEALKRRVKRLEQQQLNARKALLQIQDDGAGMEEFRAGLIEDARKAAQDKVETQEEIQQLERQQHQWERVQERLKHARVWCDAVTHAEGTLSYEERRTVLYGLGTLVTVYPAGSRPRARLKVGDQTIELKGTNGVEQPVLLNEIVSQSYCPRASRSS